MAKQNLKIYTVSQINSMVKITLEENLPPRLIVSGEISDFKRHSSGHCYFSLKDPGGVIPCVMWSSSFKRTKFAPENGMAVLATGFVDVYEPQGKYQFYVNKLQPEGLGALQLAFDQMVKKLHAEGLFDEEHKKAIPPYPMRIGILTSESGAAIKDIEESIRSRWPCAKLFLYPVPVQGEGAAEKIANALIDVNERNEELGLEILIVGRGGGSLEDLWAFNEEPLIRAIFASTIPVISAVGHEVDTTIADLVADARASTPTRAGVTAVPDMNEVLEQLDFFEQRISSKLQWSLELNKKNLDSILASVVFRQPLLQVLNRQQYLDELLSSAKTSIKQMLSSMQAAVAEKFEQASRIEPHRLLGAKNLELTALLNRANSALANSTNRANLQLNTWENRLRPLDPKSVLSRGYSITRNERTGKIIKKPADVKVGENITTELAEKFLIESQVIKK
jgi:exodeoxyribonuclease VII large subunit